MTSITKTPDAETRRIVRKSRADARTTLYKLVYGEAKSGLGMADPARDSRKKPRYETPTAFYTAGSTFTFTLPFCGFDVEKGEALLKHFNNLRPADAHPLVLFQVHNFVPEGAQIVDLRPEGVENMTIIETPLLSTPPAWGQEAAVADEDIERAFIEQTSPSADCLGELPVGYDNGPEPSASLGKLPKKRAPKKKAEPEVSASMQLHVEPAPKKARAPRKAKTEKAA